MLRPTDKSKPILTRDLEISLKEACRTLLSINGSNQICWTHLLSKIVIQALNQPTKMEGEKIKRAAKKAKLCSMTGAK